MASSSLDMKGINLQGEGSAALHNEDGEPTFLHKQTISSKWTKEEQAILEEGLAKYASESYMLRYAKIAALLDDKEIRDVVMRCRSMTKKEIGKKKKGDLNERTSNDRKEEALVAEPNGNGN